MAVSSSSSVLDGLVVRRGFVFKEVLLCEVFGIVVDWEETELGHVQWDSILKS